MNRADHLLQRLQNIPQIDHPYVKAGKYFDLLCSDLASRLMSLEECLSEIVPGVDIPSYDFEICSVNKQGGSEESDSYREFSTTRASLRLYVNQPTGWIVGEIRYKHRFSRKTFRFAQSFIANDQGEYPQKLMGYLSDLSSNLIRDVAERLFNILLECRITEEDLLPQTDHA